MLAKAPQGRTFRGRSVTGRAQPFSMAYFTVRVKAWVADPALLRAVMVNEYVPVAAVDFTETMARP